MLSSLNQLFCGFECEHNGKVYKFGVVTMRHVAEFTSYLEQRLLDSVAKLKDKLSKEEYSKLQLNCLTEIATEKYAFPSEAFFEALSTPSGLVKFLKILSPQYTEEELLELLANKAEELVLRVKSRVSPPPFSSETVEQNPAIQLEPQI